ncbi:hypothetical protein JTE90_013967 [Oedothorax gibbosus]|uniref:Uncharacterized protein n=1 Tax=Oedothorax gibbosus TaxID=931172 RepID=A0AAV6UBX0_9ARAC|nr:hypothetical protein JTE90_013967 [Oedothorax gibbosus]
MATRWNFPRNALRDQVWSLMRNAIPSPLKTMKRRIKNTILEHRWAEKNTQKEGIQSLNLGIFCLAVTLIYSEFVLVLGIAPAPVY